MACRVCGLEVRKLHGPGLCVFCAERMEQAIHRWCDGVERDLQVMVEFDAYCALHEHAHTVHGKCD